MDAYKEAIVNKFDNLLKQGKEILSKSGWDGQEYGRWPDSIDYQSWRLQALNLIERVCGKNSAHFTQMNLIATDKNTRDNPYYFKDCFGILQGAFADYVDGLLFNIRRVIRADLLSDLISQVEELLEHNYFIPAVSLTGAILEDTLRKLADKHNLEYPEKTNINALNTLLAKAQVYDKLYFKEITAKADLRNSADHAEFDKVKPEDAKDMVRWVKRFVTEFLN